MKSSFLPKKNLKGAISPYAEKCIGYPAQGNYLTALVMGIGQVPITFSHQGSTTLDSILAYDRAEVSEAYIGQINMSIVSSFCGPQGLIWGYDAATQEHHDISSIFPAEKLSEFPQTEIRNGENLLDASKSLFGTLKEKHFPLLPGSYVPCAGRFSIQKGPCVLYGATAIGIPKDRENVACLLMEDTGELKKRNTKTQRQEILLNAVRSVLAVGKNHNITYEKVFVAFRAKEIPPQHMGCALVAMPYFLLAKNASSHNPTQQSLQEWETTHWNNR